MIDDQDSSFEQRLEEINKLLAEAGHPEVDHSSGPLLTASEAVYGFAAWLTTREEVMSIGSSEVCYPIAEAVEQFIAVQELEAPRESFYPYNLKQMPMEVDIDLNKIEQDAQSLAMKYSGEVFTEMPNPTATDLNDPVFNAIWEVTKSWDVNAPSHYAGYCGMNGSHVMLILNAIREMQEKEVGDFTLDYFWSKFDNITTPTPKVNLSISEKAVWDFGQSESEPVRFSKPNSSIEAAFEDPNA